MMKALILAAGFGTRLRPYTEHRPKPLFTINRQPLLDIWIRKLERAGCEAVMVNAHHLSEHIAAFLDSAHYDIPVHLCYEPEILGTGGAIQNAADFWDERPFMVVNSDVLSDIDLKAVYGFHLNHPDPATLVLCDDSRFNSVCLDSGGENIENSGERGSGLTFTGIQVLDPLVLKYIPQNTFYSSIDAYRQMIDEGLNVRAFCPAPLKWTDLGTPERYQAAAADAVIKAGFSRLRPGLPNEEIHREPLSGDGSDRGWTRLISGRDSLILADHGIQEPSERISEAAAFIAIGEHLRKKGLPVPGIYEHDAFSGLVLLEDLDDVRLQDAVCTNPSRKNVMALYQRVIDRLIEMWARGADGFDPKWAWQSEEYDRELILEKECRYFCEAFLCDYAEISISFEELKPEFEHLAAEALRFGARGFIHRDFQSRNIMLRCNTPYFIDFQGGRLGPLQYDLASLLIDPYAGLSEKQQDELLLYCLKQLSRHQDIDMSRFCHSYEYCALSRNLQMLGAFSFLSRVKQKPFFEDYIPPAIKSLKTRLAKMKSEFPQLTSVLNSL